MSGGRRRGRSGNSARKPGARAKRESSAGGVVFRATSGGPVFLLIRDSYGKWGFPKGHLERGERADTAALREVMEETGLRDVRVVASVETIEWKFRFHGALIHKRCQFFLMETATERTTPQGSEGITACNWMTLDDARRALSYENARGVLQRASDILAARRAFSPAPGEAPQPA